MTPLPIDAHLPALLSTLRDAKSLVLVAQPGAGKTTRVPPAIVKAGLLSPEHPNLILLQPRRVAARAAAHRIADENRWRLGEEVGYHIRFEKRIGPATRLRVATEGILTRQLLDNPFLDDIGCVVLDEFHERSIHTDLAIALLREIQQTVRPDLLIVVMSASLAAEPVSRFLGKAPIRNVEGRTFPVTISHWHDPQHPHLVERVAAAVEKTLHDAEADDGDLLVFLPGAEEIRRVGRHLEPLALREKLLVLPLHGNVASDDQMLALKPADRRKVVLATNIAETSLTIEGVTTVIDSGYARVASYDPQRGLDRLDLRRISQASAIQRAGRAGRTAPGRCIRLWPEREQKHLPEYETPEIRRVDLCQTLLTLHAWGQSEPRKFGWFEPPTEEMLTSAERLLAMLGALSAEQGGRITDLGGKLLALPVHPRLGRLLLAAAERGLADDAAAVAAMLSEKDFLISPPPGQTAAWKSHGHSDLTVRLEMLDLAERSRFAADLRSQGIDAPTARRVARTRDDLHRLLPRHAPANAVRAKEAGDSEALLAQCVLVAYPDRVCRRRGNSPLGALVGGGGVRLSPDSAVARAELFLALDPRADERSQAQEATVRMACALELPWLEALFPAAVRRERGVIFDEQLGRVVGVARVWYRDLLLQEDRITTLDPEQAAQVLAAAVRPKAAEIIAKNEAAQTFLARVTLLREAMPEQPWPAFSADELAEVLTEACHGKRSLADLENTPWVPLLQSRLPYPLDRLLNEHAPEALSVPSGNRIRLQYDLGQPPVLAVRLQELFGWTDTPRIAGGRVPVLLHLLGPNFRPVQVTRDLRSFWSSAYFEIRKDLRARYPKHSWPEDPLHAKAESKGRPRQF